MEKPATHQLELPGVGSLNVWSGQVDFVIPVWATDDVASLVRSDSPDQVTIEVDVTYQACDDTACRLPRSERLSLEVPVGSYVGPALGDGGMPGAETTDMDSRKWFLSMVGRGLESTPDQAAAVQYLEGIQKAYAEGPLGRGSSESD